VIKKETHKFFSIMQSPFGRKENLRSWSRGFEHRYTYFSDTFQQNPKMQLMFPKTRQASDDQGETKVMYVSLHVFTDGKQLDKMNSPLIKAVWGEMRERVPCAALLQSWIPDEFWQHNTKKGLGKLTMVWRALTLNSKITISF
jgi:hypothetical protein